MAVSKPHSNEFSPQSAVLHYLVFYSDKHLAAAAARDVCAAARSDAAGVILEPRV